MPSIIEYSPPPTIKRFIKYNLPAKLWYAWVVGPVGSGKTTANFFKLVYHAQQQMPSPDGTRRTRAVIVRNTMPQLKDTTLVSWSYWFKDGEAGDWNATDKNFTLRFRAHDGSLCECVVMFRPLDTEDDVSRVLSLEINFAIIDEFVQIPRKIIDNLSSRLGRYKLPDGTNPTVWGMWGSSNTDTEDNWWYNYLHRSSPDANLDLPASGQYFLQPSGLSDEAENLENLPPYDGSNAYYLNQMEGKSEGWINQYIRAEWGFSAAGKPVVDSFKPALHISHSRLRYDPLLPLILGLDPGLAGTALIFTQYDLHSRLLVLGELLASNIGAKRFIVERLRPYLRTYFPLVLQTNNLIVAPDPAANNRQPSDERTIAQDFRDAFGTHAVKVETNNRLHIRLDAIEHCTTRLTDVGPALLIDEKMCPVLIRALKGGWRWKINTKTDEATGKEPEDNMFTHPGDGFGYAARYAHKAEGRMLFSPEGKLMPKFVPPRNQGVRYHFT